jgi:hypothetical protein
MNRVKFPILSAVAKALALRSVSRYSSLFSRRRLLILSALPSVGCIVSTQLHYLSSAFASALLQHFALKRSNWGWQLWHWRHRSSACEVTGRGIAGGQKMAYRLSAGIASWMRCDASGWRLPMVEAVCRLVSGGAGAWCVDQVRGFVRFAPQRFFTLPRRPPVYSQHVDTHKCRTRRRETMR